MAPARSWGQQLRESLSPGRWLNGRCGNYCGQGHCGGIRSTEQQCRFTVAATDCTDACCMSHDRCCGFGERSSCNSGIVSCISRCSRTMCGTLVREAMSFVVRKCCSRDCEGEVARPVSQQAPSGSLSSRLTSMMGATSQRVSQWGASANQALSSAVNRGRDRVSSWWSSLRGGSASGNQGSSNYRAPSNQGSSTSSWWSRLRGRSG